MFIYQLEVADEESKVMKIHWIYWTKTFSHTVKQHIAAIKWHEPHKPQLQGLYHIFNLHPEMWWCIV